MLTKFHFSLHRKSGKDTVVGKSREDLVNVQTLHHGESTMTNTTKLSPFD